MSYQWEALEAKTTTEGQTSLAWSLASPVADGSSGVIMLARNGLAVLPEEITVSEDGATVTYTPAAAFVAGEQVWGRVLADSVTALPLQTMHAGDTAVAWTLGRPVANIASPTATLYLNGQEVGAGAISVGSDGLTIAYVPDSASEAEAEVWGWYVSTADAAAGDTTAGSILTAAMEVVRRRLGLETEEWPDSALYAEVEAVLALYTGRFEHLSDVGSLSAADVTLMGRVVGLNTAARLLSGIVFTRSGGLQSLEGMGVSMTFKAAAGSDALGSALKSEARQAFATTTAMRAYYREFAAGHHLFRVNGPSRNPKPISLKWWSNLFDEMFLAPYPAAWPLGWDTSQ